MARRSIQGKIIAPTFAHITNKQVHNRSISAFVLNQRHKKCKLSPSFLKQPLYVSNNPVDTSSTSSSSGAAYHASANQQIVARRNEINRQKRQARQKALDKDRERNLKLRNLFMEEKQADNNSSSSSSSSSSTIPPMFAVKVVTCRTLRLELKMNGREKRGRMFVERPSLFSTLQIDDEQLDGDASDDDDNNEYACMSLKALKQTIHEFFRRLKKSTYILSASLPILDEDGNVLTSEEGDDDDDDDQNSSPLGMWRLETDEDVQNAFLQAEQFFQRHQEENESTSMKRPTLVIHVTKDPDAPPPPPPPPYLVGMPDPLTSPTMTMLSFYAFPPNGGISDPESTADQLKRLWRPFRALGRVYVANEGVNAQMSVPTNVLSNFLQCCTVSPEEGGELSHVLGAYMENGINIDPIPVDMEEFQAKPAFKNLHIRVRSQIVADGFATPLDWQSAGYDMPPLEWHQKLKEAREAHEKGEEDKPLPIVLDCRNDYETQVGRFELAEPLDTENFRDSWDVLKDRLKDVPKDAPVMTYCTGGIRCVKVNAFLTQEMGMTNVSRLAGGIISYDRTLNEQAPAEESMFKGVNYVFDSRMGRRITDDQLGTCFTCGSKTHLVSNCKNENCHRRMVQCENCADVLLGTCSEGCKGRVVNAGMVPNRKRETTNNTGDETRQESDEVYANVDEYSSGYSSSSPALFRQIELNTAALLPSGAHMVSGQMQGALLKMLASQTSGRILEIGSFTGYATACFLEGAAIAGELINEKDAGGREGGPFVLSLERDRRALGIASAHIKAMSELGLGKEAAKEASKIADGPIVDFEGDSVSFTYKGIAGCEFLRVNDALATVEEMASSQSHFAPFDIAFVDADKTRLMDYVDALVSNDRLLKKGGLIIVDNVLWKGLVLDANNSVHNSSDETTPTGSSEEKEMLKKNRRARKLAMNMHQFNSEVVNDERVEVVMMPIRDGLSLIRKR